MADEEGDIMTLKEAVEAQNTREEDAIAVLGAADDSNCTYTKGYMDRQAVFYCTTCDPMQTSRAGVCYACAVHCHKSHELVELYTKRDFRCDCGNTKFDGFKCTLQEEKEAVNERNKYNHNYAGKYCTCARPYPDPEDEVEDEMIQCIVCEDWFHSRHLGDLAPAAYAEMICDGCVQKHPFLDYYKDFEVPPVVTVKNSDTNNDVDVVSTSSDGGVTPGVVERNETDTSQVSSCKLQQLKEKYKTPTEKLVVKFFQEEWRSQLCKCEECVQMYAAEGVPYLVNTSDTIQFYEEKGKQNVEKVLEEAATTISNLDQVQHVELMHGFHALKNGMHEFFGQFPEGHVISTDDVKGFFDILQKNKRRRLDGEYP